MQNSPRPSVLPARFFFCFLRKFHSQYATSDGHAELPSIHTATNLRKKNNDLSGICLSVIVALKRLIQMPIHSVRLSLNTYRHVADPTEADIPATLRCTHHKD